MIKIGTRGSELALWQANYVADLIGREKIQIVIIKTKGDKIQDLSFNKMEGKGFFTKEIEEALLDKRIDAAVHSMKDLPTEEVPGLKIAAVPRRENPGDILLIRHEAYREGKPLPVIERAIIGTSSLRRTAQIRCMSDSIEVEPLRGNVTTRIKKLTEKKYDAIILADAGLTRLNIAPGDLKIYKLPIESFLPAPAQGALAIQIRDAEEEIQNIISRFNHRETELAVTAERSFLKFFGGGCHIPLGALAEVEGGKINLSGIVASTDGRTAIRKNISGDDPEILGEELAKQMISEGADKLI